MSELPKIPFLDLSAHHAPFREEFMDAFGMVMDSSAFAGGEFVSEFESRFAEFCGTRHAIGLSSGTDAIWLALLALGIGPGDEVITVPMTFIATVEAILRIGARPVFVDIDPVTYTMSPSDLEQAITERTKAIMPVHLFGRLADMKGIGAIANKYNLPVVEDAAQAHGASDGNTMAGAFGIAGAFSFYPGKNLGAFGDAGALTTNDAQIAALARMVRDHGQSQKYIHSVSGWNCRMDGIQAAVLSLKLSRLAANNERRAEHAEFYNTKLKGIPDILLPAGGKACSNVHHIFAIRSGSRSELLKHFESHGIGYGIHYPVPAHLQPCCGFLGGAVGDFPVSETCAKEFVSLPMYPEMTGAQRERVVQVLLGFSEAMAA